jgi:hypothetical protein
MFGVEDATFRSFCINHNYRLTLRMTVMQHTSPCACLRNLLFCLHHLSVCIEHADGQGFATGHS